MKLVLGTAQFDSEYGITNKKKISNFEKKKILSYSKKNFKYMDCAISYTKSNKILSNLSIKKIKVNSKINLNSSHTNYDYLKKDITNHICYLNLNKLNILFIHNFENFCKFKNQKKIILNLTKLKKKKIINKIGISVYESNKVYYYKFLKYFDYIQFPLNVFDRRFVKKKLINLFKKYNIKLQVRSIFLQGLLNSNKLPKNFFKYKKIFDKWNSWCEAKNINKTHACVAFVKKYNFIDEIVVGVKSFEEIRLINKYFKKKTNKLEFLKLNITKKLADPRLWK